MTVNCCKVKFSWNFATFLVFRRQWQLNEKRMKIDPYCQRRNCSPLNVLFSDAQIALISQGVPQLGGVKQRWDGKNKSSWSHREVPSRHNAKESNESTTVCYVVQRVDRLFPCPVVTVRPACMVVGLQCSEAWRHDHDQPGEYNSSATIDCQLGELASDRHGPCTLPLLCVLL